MKEEDSEAQLLERIDESPWYSIWIDRSTNIGNRATVLVWGPLIFQEDVLEDMLYALCCQPTPQLQKLSSLWMIQFSSVTQSSLTFCDPMNRSTPGLPVHNQLPELTQTHVHRVSDAIQPSHPLSSPSPPARNPSQHQSLFQWVNSSHEVAKVLEFQLQYHSLQRNPRADLLQNGLVGSPCSPRDSEESSLTPQFKSISSSVLSFLYSPTLTSIHDHWKNHSLD